MRNPLLRLSTPAISIITLLLFSSGLYASGQTNVNFIGPQFYTTNIPVSYQERIFAWMRASYLHANSEFANAFRSANDYLYTSTTGVSEGNTPSFFKNETPSISNNSEYAAVEYEETEKILVVLVDAYGTQNYSKVVITDVDMELSILIAKDIFEKLPGGIYTVVASSANDLISQKLIIQ